MLQLSGFHCFFHSRILNDGFVNVITGSSKELEKIATHFEKKVPHLCGWLKRARDFKTGQYAKGYIKLV